MESKTEFREKRFYPVFFMIILSFFFVGIVAAMYHSTSERISLHNELQFKSKILNLFGLSNKEIEKQFEKSISKKQKGDMIYYEAANEKGLIGYAFEISGSGLWGTINAVIAVSPDYKKITGFDIISQNETPGLGGRITEDWFKNQFINKIILSGKKIVNFELIPENEESKDNKIRQITGATLSGKAVLKMIHNEYENILTEMEIEYD
ncbi:MAG: hypothetical protein CSB55_07910 [Candidatus Cloacimonadota bacterium]|nr:MAG: hypothetical protein CSB55_07910 [Candidatus Cloacimonadota bacterium]